MNIFAEALDGFYNFFSWLFDCTDESHITHNNWSSNLQRQYISNEAGLLQSPTAVCTQVCCIVWLIIKYQFN